MKIIIIFLNGIYDFFVHNKISLIILQKTIKIKSSKNQRDILHFILAHFDIKYKISRNYSHILVNVYFYA